MKRIGTAWLVACALFGTGCGSQPSSVDTFDSGGKNPPISLSSRTDPPALTSGFVLTSSDFVPVAVATNRGWPDVAEGIVIEVFRDPAGGILTIVDERISSDASTEVVGATDPSSEHSQAVVVTNTRQVTVTLSGVLHARAVRDDITDALAKASGDLNVDAVVREVAAQFDLQDRNSPGGVGVGYSTTYSDGAIDITLVVNPAANSTEVQANDVLSARTFIQRRGKMEFVVEPAVAGDPQQIRWIENGYVVSLIGPPDLVEALRDDVRSISKDPVVAIRQLIETNLRSTPLIDSARILGITIERHVGGRGTAGAVCVIDSAGAVGCAPYTLVGSITSLLVGSTWTLVAIVPSEKPTTHFETAPAIRFDSVVLNRFDWSLGLPDGDAKSISVSFGTEGIANDFAATLSRPD